MPTFWHHFINSNVCLISSIVSVGIPNIKLPLQLILYFWAVKTFCLRLSTLALECALRYFNTRVEPDSNPVLILVTFNFLKYSQVTGEIELQKRAWTCINLISSNNFSFFKVSYINRSLFSPIKVSSHIPNPEPYFNALFICGTIFSIDNRL